MMQSWKMALDNRTGAAKVILVWQKVTRNCPQDRRVFHTQHTVRNSIRLPFKRCNFDRIYQVTDLISSFTKYASGICFHFSKKNLWQWRTYISGRCSGEGMTEFALYCHLNIICINSFLPAMITINFSIFKNISYVFWKENIQLEQNSISKYM